MTSLNAVYRSLLIINPDLSPDTKPGEKRDTEKVSEECYVGKHGNENGTGKRGEGGTDDIREKHYSKIWCHCRDVYDFCTSCFSFWSQYFSIEQWERHAHKPDGKTVLTGLYSSVQWHGIRSYSCASHFNHIGRKRSLGRSRLPPSCQLVLTTISLAHSSMWTLRLFYFSSAGLDIRLLRFGE